MLKGLFERLGLKKLNVVDLDAVDNKTAENLVIKFRGATSILEKAKITKEFLSLSILERAKQIKSANSVDKVVPKSGEEIQGVDAEEENNAEERFSDNDTLNKAHRILSLGKDITLQDLEYLTEAETLKINELVDGGDEKAIEVDSMLDGITSMFTVVFDAIDNEDGDGDVELDGIKEVKIQKLLTDILLDRKGEMDEHKKEKSLKELQALIKNNNTARKIVEDIVSSVDDYEKDEINENCPSLFGDGGL